MTPYANPDRSKISRSLLITSLLRFVLSARDLLWSSFILPLGLPILSELPSATVGFDSGVATPEDGSGLPRSPLCSLALGAGNLFMRFSSSASVPLSVVEVESLVKVGGGRSWSCTLPNSWVGMELAGEANVSEGSSSSHFCRW